MQKLFLLISSVVGALGVLIGAFGAHGLKNVLEANGRAETFDTAVKYHFYHTLAMLAVAVLAGQWTDKYLDWAFWCLLVGIAVFSGSLYALSVSGFSKLGAITPIGGLFFVAGWLFLFLAAYRR